MLGPGSLRCQIMLILQVMHPLLWGAGRRDAYNLGFGAQKWALAA